MNVNGAAVPIKQTGIAWKSDKEDKFGHYTSQNFNIVPDLRGGATIGDGGYNTTFVSSQERPLSASCFLSGVKESARRLERGPLSETPV
jgi:hypothetical protein